MGLKTLAALSREAKEQETTFVPRGLKDRAWEFTDTRHMTWAEGPAFACFSGCSGLGRTWVHSRLFEGEETGHAAPSTGAEAPTLRGERWAPPTDLPSRVAGHLQGWRLPHVHTLLPTESCNELQTRSLFSVQGHWWDVSPNFPSNRQLEMTSPFSNPPLKSDREYAYPSSNCICKIKIQKDFSPPVYPNSTNSRHMWEIRFHRLSLALVRKNFLHK